MGAAQTGNNYQRPPVQRAPQAPQAPSLTGPAAPNGIPTPGAPQPVSTGGAPGVYSYGIGGSPNLGTNMNTSAVTAGLADLNSKFNQLPLTPEMALGQASLLSQFQNELAQAQAGYANTAAQTNLQFGRLGTDEMRANEGLGSSMADRGVLDRGSGAAGQGYANQAADFNRVRQDMTLAAQEQMAQYIRQMQNAYGAYGQGLSGLALDSARYSSGNPAYGTGAR